MSENLRVLAMLIALTGIAVSIFYLTAHRPFSFSLVDRECEDAQQQYYNARDGLRVSKNKYPAQQEESRSDAREHADVCAQNRMADAAEAGFWLLLFSLAAASAAAVAGWVTVNVMRDSAQRQMRAYVGIFAGAIRLVNLTTGGMGIAVNVELKNEGQTPAYDFTTWLSPPVVDVPDAVPFGEPTPIPERTGASVLSPHTSAHVHFTIAISAAELAELQAGTKRVFAWGGLDYTDAFGQDRHYRFRCLDNLATGLRSPGDGVGLSPHKLGYDAN